MRHPVATHHSLEARVQLHQEGRLEGHGKHPLLYHGTLYVVILDDDVLLEYLDGIQLVCALPFRQHDLLEHHNTSHNNTPHHHTLPNDPLPNTIR